MTFDTPTNFTEGIASQTRGLLTPRWLKKAYRAGWVPHAVTESGLVDWWFYEERAIAVPSDARVKKTTRRSCSKYEISADTAFAEVIAACAAQPRSGENWITPEFVASYLQLHDQGVAHSIEVWFEGKLVAGSYGVGLGTMFAAESTFHKKRGAGKVALAAELELFGDELTFIDHQELAPYKKEFGAKVVHHTTFLELLAEAVAADSPVWRRERRGFTRITP